MSKTKQKPKIIAFSGKLGSGKNYIAEQLFKNMLSPQTPTLVMAFADQLKVDCCVKDGIDYHRAFITKDEESRILMQKRGTEEGRHKYGEDIWIKTMDTWIRVYMSRGINQFIITDARFPNEVDWIQKNGGMVVRVEAPKRNLDALEQESGGDPDFKDKIANHASEVSLDNFQGFDYIILNDPEYQHTVTNQVRDIARIYNQLEFTSLTVFCDLDDTICKCGEHYYRIILETRVIIEKKLGKPLIDGIWQNLLRKYVWSFEDRYYHRNDFANSLKKVAMEVLKEKDDSYETFKRIYDLGMSVFDANYEFLYENTEEILKKMDQKARLVIFTMGDHAEQMKKICHLKLFDYPIEIFPHKDKNMFQYLKQKYPSKNYMMIGDSLKRDIHPAMDAGIDYLYHISNEIKDELVVTIPCLNNVILDNIDELTGK